ncbi:MAG TPA: lytic transglycosylase domain-containing protein [Rhodospirillaceae bacterium]|nr:lytic transglycosylase domain-containing protein [Rhodospirillaceae bacterium]
MKQPDDPNAVQLAAQTASTRVASHIKAASRNTGVSFSYLMAQANKESSFETGAGSPVSSAAGLFQFTKGTWLQLIKTHGAAHGLEDLASHIRRTGQGDYVVDDAKLRHRILDLRRDPQVASMMAGEYAKDNKTWLEKTLGRKVGSAELYMAHFLGPGGAAKVLKAKVADDSQAAADLLPQAARMNPTVFYEADHTPSSVAAVYERIRHAIERPMRQYARLDEAAAGGQAGHHQTRAGARAADAAWPFETGGWPPAYLPPVPVTAAAAAQASVAYTASARSADQISAPMPPAPGVTQSAPTPLQHLLKTLFG